MAVRAAASTAPGDEQQSDDAFEAGDQDDRDVAGDEVEAQGVGGLDRELLGADVGKELQDPEEQEHESHGDAQQTDAVADEKAVDRPRRASEARACGLSRARRLHEQRLKVDRERRDRVRGEVGEGVFSDERGDA